MVDPGFQVKSSGRLRNRQLLSVCHLVHYICERLLQIVDNLIKFSLRWQEKENASSMWIAKNSFPYVNRAIDCTHVKIKMQAIAYDALFFQENVLFFSLLSESKQKLLCIPH